MNSVSLRPKRDRRLLPREPCGTEQSGAPAVGDPGRGERLMVAIEASDGLPEPSTPLTESRHALLTIGHLGGSLE
jgi:hypothetical protein